MLRYLSLILSLFASACVHRAEPFRYGLFGNTASYIPARLALLRCQAWPEGARFAEQPVTNASPQEFADFCAAVDKFMLSGFSEQPYMRGISPAVIDKLLDRMAPPEQARSNIAEQPVTDRGLASSAPSTMPSPTATPLPSKASSGLITDPAQLPPEPPRLSFIAELPKLWQFQPDACSDCRFAPEYYAKSIAPRPEWQLWLTAFSKATQNSDAILVPFVTHLSTRVVDDRGLLLARRQAGLVILLIDSNSGALLWSGGRTADIAERQLGPASSNGPQFPALQAVVDRVLIEDLWREFPGRQIY